MVCEVQGAWLVCWTQLHAFCLTRKFILPSLLLCPSTLNQHHINTCPHSPISQHALGSSIQDNTACEYSTLWRPLLGAIRQSQENRLVLSHFFCYCSLTVISIQLAEQTHEKQAKQVAAQEKAQARKDKQAKNKAKAAECKCCQNQENIDKLCFSSISLLLRQHAFSSWHKAVGWRWFPPTCSSRCYHKLTPHFIFHACSLSLPYSSVCMMYLQVSKLLPSISPPAPARFLLHMSVWLSNPSHRMAMGQR